MASDFLPFSEPRQRAVLGHLLFNSAFFKQSQDKILPKWFINVWDSKVWQAKLAFIHQFKREPSIEELAAGDVFRIATQIERTQMAVAIEEARNLTNVYRLDSLVPELTDWLHSRTIHNLVSQVQDLYNRQKTPEIIAALDDGVKFLKNTTFREDKAYDFSNFINHFARRELEFKNGLTFGISAIDQLLTPTTDGKGGLLKGDTTILLAPTNVGKTTTMISVAAANVLECKHVLMLTHEGVDDDIAEKMWMSMLNVNRTELFEMARTSEGRGRMMTASAFLARFFRYVPMNKAGMNVEDVAAVIRREQEDRVAQFGAGFDLVIDDYPAKLGSIQMQYGQFQKRNLDEYVYNYFVQLALEYKFHCLLAIQANRTGAKINRGQKGYDERLLVMEDVNESYGPMQIATNVITINRSPLDEALGFVTFYISKSRSQEKGWAVVCKTLWGHCITHSNSLGATWYRGETPLGEQIQPLFNKYKGTAMPAFRNLADLMTAATVPATVQAQA